MVKIVIENGDYKSIQSFDINDIQTLMLTVNGNDVFNITKDTILSSKEEDIDSLFDADFFRF